MECGGDLISKMKPLILAETAKKCRYRFQCAMLCCPFDVFSQAIHLQYSGCVMPGSKNQRQSRFPASADTATIWQQLPERVPPLRHRANTRVFATIRDQSFRRFAHVGYFQRMEATKSSPLRGFIYRTQSVYCLTPMPPRSSQSAAVWALL